MKEAKKMQENNYPVKLSDWIVFLGGISTRYISALVFVATAFIVAVFGIPEIYRATGISTLLTIVVAGILLIYFYALIRKVGGEEKKIRNLLKEIMKGEITDPNAVRIRWLELEEKDARGL